ncbi:MAG: APC family permease [Gemmatimonadaceae bacterium]
MSPVTPTRSEAAPNARGTLHRELGLGFGLAVVVGGTVGVGILRTPGTIASLLLDPALILLVWLAGGAYCLLGANNLSEVSAAVPRAGGPYVFARRAFGPYPGFLIGWSDWLTNTVPLAYLPVALAEYTARLVPSLAGRESLVAMGTLVAFTVLNLLGLRVGSASQQVMSAAKALALLAFISAAFFLAPAAGAATGQPPTPALLRGSGSLWIALGAAMQLVIGTFGGWNAASYFSEENTNPGRSVPRALIGGLVVITVAYVMVNAAYLHVLPLSEFATTNLPAANTMQAVFGGNADRVVTMLSILLLLSIINPILMFSPRILFALSRDGFFLRQATMVNRGGTPATATIATAMVAGVLVLSGSFERLFSITAFLFIVVDLSVSFSLLRLRRAEPGLPRPYRARWAPWSTRFTALCSFALLAGFISSDPRTALVCVLMMAVSYPVFRFANRRAASGIGSA